MFLRHRGRTNKEENIVHERTEERNQWTSGVKTETEKHNLKSGS